MRGILEVKRKPPHFLFFLLTLTLEEGMDNMRLHTSAGVTINQMRRDEKAGVYILDYYIPLHLANQSSVYLVDDMVTIEQLKDGKKEVLANIRLSFTRAKHTFLCSARGWLEIEETGTFAFSEDS
jgi:hypothetical protein